MWRFGLLLCLQFWNIVPLEQLLSQLEVEQSAAVIRRIVKLLVNSFHPTGKGADTQVIGNINISLPPPPPPPPSPQKKTMKSFCMNLILGPVYMEVGDPR